MEEKANFYGYENLNCLAVEKLKKKMCWIYCRNRKKKSSRVHLLINAYAKCVFLQKLSESGCFKKLLRLKQKVLDICERQS